MNSTSSSLPSSLLSQLATQPSQSKDQSNADLPSTPPSSHELLSSPETPLPPATPTSTLPSSAGSRRDTKTTVHSLQSLSSMANDPSGAQRGLPEIVGLGLGNPGAMGFDGRAQGRGQAARGHPTYVDGANSSSKAQRALPPSTASAVPTSHHQPTFSSSRLAAGVQSQAGGPPSSSSSSTLPPPSSSIPSSAVPFKRTLSSSPKPSSLNPNPLSASSTFTIRPTPVPIANEGDDPMRSPSPSPQRPETFNSLVAPTGSDSDEDAVGEDEDEEEPLGVPTSEEVQKLEEKVRELTMEYGLGEDEEVGDDESKEMRGLRAMRDFITPLLPALHMLPTFQSQVLSQSETITSLRRVLTIQAELAQRATEESRAIQEVERAGWESSLNVLLEKAREAHSKEMAMQQEKLSQFKPKGWGTGPSTSKKETGFDKIETVDTDDYDKLIKKWLELQAENRKAGVEKTTMMYKIRDSENQINALTEELHFLRASALHGSRVAPQPAAPSRSNRNLPLYGSADDPSLPLARRQTLGDARAEHLLLAAKRLRTLRITNPDIGLIRTGDYGLAGMDVPEDVRNLGGVLAKAGAPGATLNSMIIGSSAAGGFDSSGLDGDGDEDMGSSVMGTVGGRTPKPKAVRGKGKKTLAAVPGHQVVASSSIAASAPVPRTPKGKSPSKKKAGASGVPSVGEQTPGGTAIPASFSDLLMAAGVYSQPTTTTKIGTSATRGSANADDGEDEIDELESEDDPTNLNESPKRRRVEGAAPSSWVPGQTLTSGQLPQYQQQSVAGPSVPRNPLNSSTGSEGTMHATALDLLALASFGSQDPSSSNPSSQPVASSSSSRLGGVMASSQPSLSHNGFGGEGLVSLDAPFVLRSSPDPPHGRSSPSFYPAQATPLRPQHGQYQNDDVFSPSTPGSSIPSRVKDFSMGGGGTNGGPESPFGSPSGQAAAAGGGTGGAGNFVNLSSANIQTANTANNMPARRVRSPYLKWSNEEDELLARGVAKYGQKWDLVSKAVPTRSYHQCRQRWLRKLGVFDHKPALPASTSNAATIFGGHAEEAT